MTQPGAAQKASGDAIPLIYNPASGGGRGRVRLKKAEAVLALHNLQTRRIATQSPGHAAELAAELGAKHDTILVLGGDGTHSEAANGILDAGLDTNIGFLPSGTGNDFLRDLELPSLDAAVEAVVRGRVKPVDAIRIEGDGYEGWSINLFGCGFAPRVTDLTNRRFKWMGGPGYTVATLIQLTRLSNFDTHVKLDGKDLDWVTPFITVCNSRYTGGGMLMAPDAKPDDGLFDVLHLDAMRRTELLGIFPKIFSGKHVLHPKVHITQGKKLHIEQEPGPLLVDGEVVGSTPTTLTLKPKALNVFW